MSRYMPKEDSKVPQHAVLVGYCITIEMDLKEGYR